MLLASSRPVHHSSPKTEGVDPNSNNLFMVVSGRKEVMCGIISPDSG